MTDQEQNNTRQETDKETMNVDEREESIWHTGTPAEAINLALSQGRLFLVWISQSTSEDAVASEWKTLWSDSTIKSSLSEHCVSITLSQDSTDSAMFLQLIGSPPSSTGVWIVFGGQLLTTFNHPLSPEEMQQKLHTAITKTEQLKNAPTQSTLPSSSTNSIPIPTDPETQARNEKIKAQLAARRAKLEAAKQKHDTETKESRRIAASKQATTTDPERKKYITQHDEQRQRDKQTRMNILRDIENDKAERKARAERDRKGYSNPPSSSAPIVHSGMTKLSIRQPNSTILKGEFETTQTLIDVRQYIDFNRTDSSNSPYVLQTTFPTRTFEVAEEQHETLGEIYGKGGSLIMKEIKQFSNAYETPGVVGLASSLLGSVTGTISNVLGWNSPVVVPETTPGDAIREARIRSVNYSARERGVNMDRETRDGDSEGEKNWFNGNGLAQEAPPRDDEKKD